MLGQRLNDYELVKALGTGGMGAVFEARHTTTGQRVAIKVLHPAFADNPTLFERFRTEAKIGATIGHPAIVEVFGFGATKEGCPYLVMELLEGRPFEVLCASRVDVDTAVTVTIELMDALDAAHRHGFVHRDLKPANLFLSRAGQTERVRLLDFGIAHVMTPELQLALTGSAIIGTPGYMAPEQLDAAAIDARVDLYAAGCILFELLTGRRAVEGRSRSEVLLNSLRGEFPNVSTLRPEVPPALDALVAQLLEKEPARRPASAGEVRDRIRQIKHQRGARENAVGRRVDRGPGSLYLIERFVDGQMRRIDIGVTVARAQDVDVVLDLGSRRSQLVERIERTRGRFSRELGDLLRLHLQVGRECDRVLVLFVANRRQDEVGTQCGNRCHQQEAQDTNTGSAFPCLQRACRRTHIALLPNTGMPCP